jgi:predicted transcriptional regulator
MRRPRRTPAPEPPPDGGKPTAVNRAFSALVAVLDLDQQKAAEALHLSRGTVSDYVSGKKELHLDNYRRKCEDFGLAPETAERALALVAAVDGDQQLRKTTSLDFASAIARLAERSAAALPAKARELAAEQDRQWFQALWTALRLSLAEWRLLVIATPELQRRVFVMLVGEASERAASTNARRALELANFALWIAERMEGEEGWQAGIFAWAFVGNARRVGSDLDGAGEAFAVSARLRGERSEELPEAWRLFDLEASLRIDLRQLPDALRLLDLAEELAPRSGSTRARLLGKRSNALEQLGDSEGSIAALRRGATLVDREAEPHLLWMLHFNLMDSLCSVGKAAEAEGMLPKLRLLQAKVGNGLNKIRLRWLEGKIDIGRGRIGKAIETLSAVRAAFNAEEIHYDEALAGMELAELYLKQGRTADVKRLVQQMAAVFRTKSVHEEAKKALGLFRRAVETETVTIELVRCVVVYLRRAQNDPKLRFEEAA